LPHLLAGSCLAAAARHTATALGNQMHGGRLPGTLVLCHDPLLQIKFQDSHTSRSNQKQIKRSRMSTVRNGAKGSE
jgi:hypothetical protein